MIPRLENAAARRLFLHRHGLGASPSGPGRGADLLGLIEALGFVQVDSVSTVERAHHMILHSRRTRYRPAHLRPLLERDRRLFEHWTHDAAVIPTAFLGHWQHKFARDRAFIERRWKSWRREGYQARFRPVLDHIARHGPCRSDTFAEPEGKTGEGWWDWHPSKTALEFLWRSGRLAVTRREGFRKVYDLAERVLPPPRPVPSEAETVDWACAAALDRLGFATSGELAAFWDLATPAEAKAWVADALAQGRVDPLDVIGADGRPRRAVAWPGTPAGAAALPPAPGVLRILSPFDPALRDRARAERLWGFRYRIEIFVPAERRSYGYYVFPLLDGEHLVGRLDMTADRAADTLAVTALWPERGVRWGAGRQARLDAALARTARLAGVSRIAFADGWLRA
ncbi:winged helix-turn-helix domain-containing protein [Rhodobacteraceae bacterium CCMM004]|nr:winged helix-turn-helix domain-containing protein [Rhodobacteraceae bacterium CCMM004]